MFKKFIERIAKAKNKIAAVNNVFYGQDGVDMAYQKEKITWKEHQLLWEIINKLA